MPGRCLTGSRPLSTRIELSEYSGEDANEMGDDLDAMRDQYFESIVDVNQEQAG
jgi:hypothetical protein